MAEKISGATTVRELSISPHEQEQLYAILKQHIPEHTVWAFGSRATGGPMLKRFSDLDLAVEGRLTAKQFADLAEAFDESPLPIKIDIVELAAVDQAFRERIARDFVLVQEPIIHSAKPTKA